MSVKRILVIEDDVSLMRLYTKILRDHEVIPCFTLKQAYETLNEGDFDAIICDIQIGIDRATELIEEHYLQWRKANINLVIISGRYSFRTTYEQMGIPFILKPVDMKTLRSVIDGPDAA